jgi:hypothetical protein
MRRPVLAVVILSTVATAVGALAQAPPPAYRAGVLVLAIEAQVTAVGDADISALGPADFAVTVGGRKVTLAAVTFLHDDGGPVSRDFVPSPHGDCIYSFTRRIDEETTHYRLAVEVSGDQDVFRFGENGEVIGQVRLKTANAAVRIARYGYLLRRIALMNPPGARPPLPPPGSIPPE